MANVKKCKKRYDKLLQSQGKERSRERLDDEQEERHAKELREERKMIKENLKNML